MNMVTKPRVLDARHGLTDATVAMVLTVLFVVFASMAAAKFWIIDPNVSLLLSYLAVWIPLLGAVGVAWYFHGHNLGLRFRWLDLLWGLSIGLLARSAASAVEILGYGQMGSSVVTFGETVYDGWWLFGALLAPVLLAPVIEELFFRGLLLRSVFGVTRTNGANRGVSAGIAVFVSAIVFALVHILTVDTVTGLWVAGLSTFLFGLAVGSLAVLTGRLGGAIIAHVT